MSEDLGSEDGSHIYAVLNGTPAQPSNVFIADIKPKLVEEGKKKYGFSPVVIDESEVLPSEDNFFDIVYCSSVIEHVTIPKEKVWSLYSGLTFQQKSLQRQKKFAKEIKRVGKQYFVQTPYRYFPIESHSWLPFMAWLPRRLLLPTLRFVNTFWIKKTNPDWYLLNKREMRQLFSEAKILSEKSLKMTKSIMAVSSR